MAVLFFAVIGAIAVTGLLLYDMDRKRQRMKSILERLGPLVKKGKFRAQHMRRLSMSLFMSQQLKAALEREVLLLEREHEIPPPDPDKGGFALTAGKSLQLLEDRVAMLEGITSAKAKAEEAAQLAAEEAADSEEPAGEAVEPQEADAETEDPADSP